MTLTYCRSLKPIYSQATLLETSTKQPDSIYPRLIRLTRPNKTDLKRPIINTANFEKLNFNENELHICKTSQSCY